MNATPDRYLDEALITNDPGLLEVETSRVHSPPTSTKRRTADPQRPPARLGRIAVYTGILIVVGIIAGLLPRLHHRQRTLEESRALSLATVRVAAPAPSHSALPVSLSGELRPLVEAPIYA